jgi:hypothetical protein
MEHKLFSKLYIMRYGSYCCLYCLEKSVLPAGSATEIGPLRSCAGSPVLVACLHGSPGCTHFHSFLDPQKYGIQYSCVSFMYMSASNAIHVCVRIVLNLYLR